MDIHNLSLGCCEMSVQNIREEELEFISVVPDDDQEMNIGYVDPTAPERANNSIGSAFFNQSKVS